MIPLRKAHWLTSPTGFTAFAVLVVAVNLFFQGVVFILLNNPSWVLLGHEFAVLLWLFSGFVVVRLAWTSLHSFGFVGSGTGAGFALAAYAIAARVLAELAFADGFALDANGLDWVGPARVAGVVGFLRNASLVAYGFGLALVVISTTVELRRRGATPAWTRPAD